LAARVSEEARMNVEAILRNKGSTVATVRPDATIGEVAALLRRKAIGALVVSSDGSAVDGILSERDIVHALADRGAALLELKVEELMTRRVVTCSPRDSVGDLMAKMTERRIRHIPVLRDGALAGIISIGDVVKFRLDEMEYEASSLRSFIAGA
jgi:CBS domain-containing protein